MDILVSNTDDSQTLRCEMHVKKLRTLFSHQLICAADIRCLDSSSKNCLRTICLKTLHLKQA